MEIHFYPFLMQLFVLVLFCIIICYLLRITLLKGITLPFKCWFSSVHLQLYSCNSSKLLALIIHTGFPLGFIFATISALYSAPPHHKAVQEYEELTGQEMAWVGGVLGGVEKCHSVILIHLVNFIKLINSACHEILVSTCQTTGFFNPLSKASVN